MGLLRSFHRKSPDPSLSICAPGYLEDVSPAKEFCTVAVADLDLYQKYSSNPDKNGYITNSPSVNASFLPLSSDSGFSDQFELHSDDSVTPTDTEYSQFENDGDYNTETHLNKEKQISEEPADTLINGSVNNHGFLRQVLNVVLRPYKPQPNSQARAYLKQTDYHSLSETTEKIGSKTSFDTEIIVINRYQGKSFAKTLPMSLRREKSFRRKKNMNESRSISKTVSRSILKNKTNVHEANERLRAKELDRMEVHEFIKDLEMKEQSRLEDSVMYPSLRKQQVEIYLNQK